MKYGYLPEGLRIPSYSDLLDKYYAFLEQELNMEVDRSSEGALGQLAELSVLFYVENWEFLQEFYKTFSDPEDEFLNIKASYVGLSRKAASSSTAGVVFIGSDGTNIPIDTIIQSQKTNYNFRTIEASSIDLTKMSYLLLDVETTTIDGTYYGLTINGNIVMDYTGTSSDDPVTILDKFIMGIDSFFNHRIGVEARIDPPTQLELISISSGFYFHISNESGCSVNQLGTNIEARAEEVGSLEVPAGKLNILVTPITGVDRIFNPLPAQRGKEAETDYQLRKRILDSVRISGGGSSIAIRSKIMETVAGVTWCSVFENYTGTTDSNGIPPHSFEVVLEGGSHIDIASAIYGMRPAGIRAYGQIVEQILDINGDPFPIGFSRPVPMYAWIRITIEEKNIEETFPPDGLEEIKANLYNFAKNSFKIGDDFLVQKLYAPVFQTKGLQRVTIEISINSDPDVSPVWDVLDLVISARQYLSFSMLDNRIVVEDTTI